MSFSSFESFIYGLTSECCYVLNTPYKVNQYIEIDLSKNNPLLKNLDVSSSKVLESYVASYLQKHHAGIAYGGYHEVRSIYERSPYFMETNAITARNIHLGIDLWSVAETPVLAPIKGIVHSFNNNNDSIGDYGPTIILVHQHNDVEWYSLYGHLSLDSLTAINIGQTIDKGEQFATLGDATVNGDYPPHLHFQIIKDIQHYSGDYPGVSNKEMQYFYKENCPDPNLLLKLDHILQ